MTVVLVPRVVVCEVLAVARRDILQVTGLPLRILDSWKDLNVMHMQMLFFFFGHSLFYSASVAFFRLTLASHRQVTWLSSAVLVADGRWQLGTPSLCQGCQSLHKCMKITSKKEEQLSARARDISNLEFGRIASDGVTA